MKETRQQKARKLLLRNGYTSADEIPDFIFGKKFHRNKDIVQSVIFDGQTLSGTAKRIGVSPECVRRVGLLTVRKLCGSTK